MSVLRRIGFGAVVSAGLFALACTPEYPKCKEDKHCADKGEVCVEGLCKQCSTDAQCREGFSCKDNACVPLPQCRLDADCGAGKRCAKEQCVPECQSDRECATGQACAENRCVTKAECVLDADCTGGKSCKEQKCVVSGPIDMGDAPPMPGDDAEIARRKALENCTLGRVQFDFNDFALSDSARAALDRNAECIRFKKKAVTVEGHADDRGSDEYNLVLGEKRANAAKRYLSGLGVDEGLLKTVSFGEERPVDPAQTEEAWGKNRRAELTFR